MWGWLTGETEREREREQNARREAEARLRREENERQSTEARLRREEQERQSTEARLRKEEQERQTTEVLYRRVEEEKKATEARLVKEAQERKDTEFRLLKTEQEKRDIEESANLLREQLKRERDNALKELQERQEREKKEKEVEQEKERARLRDQEEALKALEIKQRADMHYQEQKFKQEIQETERKLKEQLRQKERNLQDEINKKDEELAAFKLEKQEVENRKSKEPWRNFEANGGWNSKYHADLLCEIKNLKPHRDLQKARILFIGPIRAGKSSFINSVASIDECALANRVDAGSALKSFTLKLRQCLLDNVLKNFVLMDTMGVEEQEEEGFNVQDVIYLMEGNVKPDYKFNPRCPISESDPNFRRNPALGDKVHCVVFIMGCPVIHSDSVTDVSKKKIQVLLDYIRDHGVPMLVILTKIDEICPDVKADITTTYHSRAVELCFKKAHELFGVPKMNIFPVQNYSEEAEVNENMNILIMLALRKMMRSAIDRLKANDDQRYGERSYYQQLRQYCEIL